MQGQVAVDLDRTAIGPGLVRSDATEDVSVALGLTGRDGEVLSLQLIEVFTLQPAEGTLERTVSILR
jgi:hypothetical protein